MSVVRWQPGRGQGQGQGAGDRASVVSRLYIEGRLLGIGKFLKDQEKQRKPSILAK